MPLVTSYGVGQYAAGEAHCLLRPRKYIGAKRAVIWCHGANRTAVDGVATGYADIPRALAEDFPVLYADLGGPYTFGNAASQARLSDARTYMGALGFTTDQIILAGGSMGGALACNWARANPTLVRALLLFIPVVNIEDVRANNRNGLQANIEAAYTDNATWQTLRPTYNPVEYAASLASIPTRVWFSTNDDVCLPAQAAAFIKDSVSPAVSLGPVGHDVAGINLADVRSYAASFA